MNAGLPLVLIRPFVLIYLVFVIILIVTITWRRRRATRPEPTCGRCGCNVTGLPSAVCPECGSDLNEVGIVPPNRAAPLSTRAFAILAAVVLPIPLSLSLIVLYTFGPRRSEVTSILSLAPRSSAYYGIEVAFRHEEIRYGARRGWHTFQSSGGGGPDIRLVGGTSVITLPRFELPGREITMTLQPDAKSMRSAETLRINYSTRLYQYVTTDGTRTAPNSPPDVKALREWFARCDVGTDHPEADAELSDLARLVAAPDGGTPYATAQFTVRTISVPWRFLPLLWPIVAVVLLWLAVYVLIVRAFVIRRRRRFAPVSCLPETFRATSSSN